MTEDKPECTCYFVNGQYVCDPKCKAHPLEKSKKELEQENENLKTVMIAAAEEIKRCWQAHCDEEGYGPANLLHRLEKGIPAQYAYTAGAFEELESQLDKAKKLLGKVIEELWTYDTRILMNEIESFLNGK